MKSPQNYNPSQLNRYRKIMYKLGSLTPRVSGSTPGPINSICFAFSQPKAVNGANLVYLYSNSRNILAMRRGTFVAMFRCADFPFVVKGLSVPQVTFCAPQSLHKRRRRFCTCYESRIMRRRLKDIEYHYEFGDRLVGKLSSQHMRGPCLIPP